jgi:hypothetical protein
MAALELFETLLSELCVFFPPYHVNAVTELHFASISICSSVSENLVKRHTLSDANSNTVTAAWDTQEHKYPSKVLLQYSWSW